MPIPCTGPDCPICKLGAKPTAKMEVWIYDQHDKKSKRWVMPYKTWWEVQLRAGVFDRFPEAYRIGSD